MRNRFSLMVVICTLASLWALSSAVAVDTTTSGGQLTDQEMIFRASKLNGLNVFNRADTKQKLGSLDDMIIDAHTGHVMYGIVSTGIGGKYLPVPWQAFLLQEDRDNHKFWLTLNKNSDDLKTAPSFDRNAWPNFSDQHWKESVDHFFGVRTVARPPHMER
jgi:hypothetical protein